MPVDVPLVSPITIKALLTAVQNHPGSIIYPVYQGKWGHPPLIPVALIPDILSWTQEGGLKSVLASRSDLAVYVDVPDSAVLFDIDTDEDYRQLVERFKKSDAPPEETAQ